MLLCGCAGTHKQGTSISDPYEAATIEQMTGNNVSGAVFARTIVCLNARRETRIVTTLTNHGIPIPQLLILKLSNDLQLETDLTFVKQ